ncbi:MAG TPA: HigA family addiction module antitoxin [Myxococcota bacterium]
MSSNRCPSGNGLPRRCSASIDDTHSQFLRPAGLTQVEAARRMGIPLNRLNEIIRGRRGVTADSALRLARLFKTSPEFWMSLQSDWDLWHAAAAQRRAG